MTNSPSTDATPRPWSYEIQYGPNGEEIYAWVYYLNFMVCTVKVHHAKMIVEAVNAHDRLTAENAELREALMDATAHLVAAASAYQKYAARHRSVGRATADPMFTTRVADFEKAAKRAQSAIRALPLPGDKESQS